MIYTYVHTCMYVCVCVCVCVYRERERERQTDRQTDLSVTRELPLGTRSTLVSRGAVCVCMCMCVYVCVCVCVCVYVVRRSYPKVLRVCVPCASENPCAQTDSPPSREA
jgi:hypothetical protein